MNDNEYVTFVWGIVLATVVMAVVMILWWTPDYVWRNKAIQVGAAEYNSTNGNFQWKTNK